MSHSSSQISLDGYIEEYGRDYSYANLKLLHSTYLGNPDRIVSFVGAGVSIPLGVGDWSTLMRELVKSTPNVHAKYPSLGEERSTIGADQYPRIADEILQELGANSELFMDKIKLLTQHSTMTSSAPLEALVLAVRIHLTTNFEKCIETTYDHLNEISQDLGVFGRTPTVRYYTQALQFRTNSHEDWICYLHADLFNDIYILAESDYQTIYKHAGGANDVHGCITQFYTDHHLLFVGCSFADPFVLDCIRSISEEQRRSNQRYQSQFSFHRKTFQPNDQAHFLLIDSGTSNTKWQELLRPGKHGEEASLMVDYFDYWQRLGVHPIVYKPGKHVFLEWLFKDLRRMSRGDRND
jgi:hypothetical protein